MLPILPCEKRDLGYNLRLVLSRDLLQIACRPHSGILLAPGSQEGKATVELH